MTDYQSWRSALARANDAAFWPIEAIDALVSEGRAQFWATDAGAIVTLVETYPGGAAACTTLAGAGDLESLITALKPAIEAWAKAQGCTHCIVEGRDGWRRAHPDYRHHKTIIIKELADG